MRVCLCLTLLCVVVPGLRAEDEAQQRARLEKAGARVTVDDALPAEARLRVVFAQLDDKAAVALRGAAGVGALTVEDGPRLTDRTLVIVGTLTHLRELALFRVRATNAGLTYLKGLKDLRKLYLTDARVTDSGIAYLKDHAHLEELDLSGTAITSGAAATFKTLDNLRLLVVTRTKFGDAGAAQLKDLANLKELEALNTSLSVKAAMELEEAIPGIRIRR